VGEKNLLNLVFGSKMGKNCNLEHSKISQSQTPGDSKLTSSLGFSSENLLE